MAPAAHHGTQIEEGLQKEALMLTVGPPHLDPLELSKN